jgi:hypothetical protein
MRSASFRKEPQRGQDIFLNNFFTTRLRRGYGIAGEWTQIDTNNSNAVPTCDELAFVFLLVLVLFLNPG